MKFIDEFITLITPPMIIFYAIGTSINILHEFACNSRKRLSWVS